ncbi:16S rRNA (guanine(966)-N(2))-methyltransferase RsmD [Orrella sp. 11846]|uniref:16S rRNA (guanine(966)-N(2))-methyltransferase RsmD n=1 Tax=Orrella sp. 11846 TaxID=3409913 RepID=UPI003B5CCE29
MVKKSIRIVGGQYRRSRIEVPDGPGLRPTPDRVRETLFNWLSHFWNTDYAQKRVLDLFAGTGALGFEAASRGVSQAVLVENNPAALRCLHKTRERLQASHVQIIRADAMSFLNRPSPQCWDLILLDPPFENTWFPDLIEKTTPILCDDGLVYAESDQALNAPTGFVTLRQNRAGGVHYHLFHRSPSESR